MKKCKYKVGFTGKEKSYLSVRWFSRNISKGCNPSNILNPLYSNPTDCTGLLGDLKELQKKHVKN